MTCPDLCDVAMLTHAVPCLRLLCLIAAAQSCCVFVCLSHGSVATAETGGKQAAPGAGRRVTGGAMDKLFPGEEMGCPASRAGALERVRASLFPSLAP